MSPVKVFALIALAMLEGSLVALPRAGALPWLMRWRSAWWAVVLPSFILIGTLVPLWHPGFASGIVVVSAVGTPVMAVVGAAAVARGRRVLLVAAIATALSVALMVDGSLPASIVTAFGCMAVGVALVRLIPRAWLVLAVVAMACLDATFLMLHVGQPAAALVAHATDHLQGRAFAGAIIGPAKIDYPDLVLAGALGGFVAGKPLQLRAAVSVTVLAACFSMLVAAMPIVPATVPIALIFVFLVTPKRSPFRRRRHASTGGQPAARAQRFGARPFPARADPDPQHTYAA